MHAAFGGTSSAPSDNPTLMQEITHYLLPGFPYHNPDGPANVPVVVPAELVEEDGEEQFDEPPLGGRHI